jgi:acyl carrier protein
VTPARQHAWRQLGVPADAVLTVIGDHYGVPARSLSRDTHLARDLGTDAIDTQEVLMTLEELFEVYFDPDLGVDRVETVGDAIDLVQEALRDTRHPKPWKEAK